MACPAVVSQITANASSGRPASNASQIPAECPGRDGSHCSSPSIFFPLSTADGGGGVGGGCADDGGEGRSC